MSKIKFLANEYDRSDLEAMTDDALLTLRNLVAANLGVAAIKAFKDHTTAVEQTLKALQKFETSSDADGGTATAETAPKKTPKPKAEPKDRKLAKPASVQYVKRPTKKMFSKMAIVKAFDGTEDRAHRSGNYTDGMMIIDALETKGCLPWDIYNWEKSGFVTVTEPTDEEYAERRAEWYKKSEREDPDLAKLEAAEARKVEKAKRDAEREAKKAEKVAADAAKAAAAAADKAPDSGPAGGGTVSGQKAD